MNPQSVAEEYIERSREAYAHPEYDLARAQVFAILALAHAIDNLGHDIREAGKDVAIELGSTAIAVGNIADNQ